jgi:hypothetical protein
MAKLKRVKGRVKPTRKLKYKDSGVFPTKVMKTPAYIALASMPKWFVTAKQEEKAS